MKVLTEKYPKGTWKHQKTDGRYIDGFLYENLSLLADRIVDDMTFMGIFFSSTLEVGTGKSVFATQIGEIWTDIMNKKHNLNLKFDLNNIVWRPKELIERAFDVPKYSFVLLDEWEDNHYWSNLGTTLRTFFRKCRQLNLFIAVIIPNWFQMPISYAIGRSIFAIDVKFGDDLERGFFDFYGFDAKRDLYIKGKKFHNYHAAKSDFDGIFNDGYGVSEAEYRKRKLEDMQKWDEQEQKPSTPTEIRHELIRQFAENLKGKITQKTIAEGFGLSGAEISRILNGKRGKEPPVDELPLLNTTYYKIQNKENELLSSSPNN